MKLLKFKTKFKALFLKKYKNKDHQAMLCKKVKANWIKSLLKTLIQWIIETLKSSKKCLENSQSRRNEKIPIMFEIMYLLTDYESRWPLGK